MASPSSDPPSTVPLRKVSFVGVRTAHLEAMRRFYEDFFGLTVLHEEQAFLAFSVPDGSRIELFGLDYKSHSHFTTGPVPGFEVDDVNMAKTALQALGVELLSDVDGDPRGTQWIHFRGPDGNVYALVQRRRAHPAYAPPRDE